MCKLKYPLINLLEDMHLKCSLIKINKDKPPCDGGILDEMAVIDYIILEVIL